MRRFTLPTLTAAIALLTCSTGALAQSYTNSAPITIPDSGSATPYPSTINVTGGPTSIQGVRVRLNGFSHTYPADVLALLVGPGGQTVQLLNSAGGGTPVTNITMTLTSAFDATALPNPYITGTFAPSNGSATFNAPAPAPPYSGFALLAATNANGTWRLYVQDTTGGDLGSISGGWTIEFGNFGFAAQVASGYAFTYQGRLTGGPATGNINLRFTLWDNSGSSNSANQVAGPITVNNVPLADNLFTTKVDFGRQVPQDRKTWLQVEVANPSGSAFVNLTPRQEMSFAPVANNSAYSTNTLGANYHADANRGVKAQSGYFDPATGEFNGMRAVVNPGTNGCGNSGDLTFNTWECNTETSREIMRINGSGNVGIGTTTPTQKLHVIGNILATGTITPSCAKLKENVVPMSDALDRIANLNAVRFDWIPEEAKTRGFTHDLGFIADDVAKVFPEITFRDEKGEIIGLDYSRMSAVAVGAIKQLKAENDQLKARLEKIEAMLVVQAK